MSTTQVAAKISRKRSAATRVGGRDRPPRWARRRPAPGPPPGHRRCSSWSSGATDGVRSAATSSGAPPRGAARRAGRDHGARRWSGPCPNHCWDSAQSVPSACISPMIASTAADQRIVVRDRVVEGDRQRLVEDRVAHGDHGVPVCDGGLDGARGRQPAREVGAAGCTTLGAVLVGAAASWPRAPGGVGPGVSDEVERALNQSW